MLPASLCSEACYTLSNIFKLGGACYKESYAKKSVIGFFIFIMITGLVCAGSWDTIEGNGNSELLEVSEEDINDNIPVVDDSSDVGNVVDYGNREGSSVYTLEFYIALGVGGVGLLIIIFFIYLFLRRPENKFGFKGQSSGGNLSSFPRSAQKKEAQTKPNVSKSPLKK